MLYFPSATYLERQSTSLSSIKSLSPFSLVTMCWKRSGCLWEGYLVLAGTSFVSIDSGSSADMVLVILLDSVRFCHPWCSGSGQKESMGQCEGEAARNALACVCFSDCNYPKGDLMWTREQSPEGTCFIIFTLRVLKVQSFYPGNTWIDLIVPRMWLIKNMYLIK